MKFIFLFFWISSIFCYSQSRNPDGIKISYNNVEISDIGGDSAIYIKSHTNVDLWLKDSIIYIVFSTYDRTIYPYLIPESQNYKINRFVFVPMKTKMGFLYHSDFQEFKDTLKIEYKDNFSEFRILNKNNRKQILFYNE